MTIAAGFRCTNGIVLCSDTEYTHGQSHKTYGTKIAHFVKPQLGFSFAMAGAGNAAFMMRFFDDVADELERQIPGTIIEMTEILERFLKKLYKKYVFPIPKWQESDEGAAFLIATRTPDGTQEFLYTSTMLTAKASEYECIGMGADIGLSVIDMVSYPNLTVAEAGILSIHVLERVKATAAFCGGASAVVIQELTAVTREKKFRDVSEVEQCLRDLQAEITPLILSWADESLPEEQFQERLRRVTAKVNALRNRFLRERENWKLTTVELMEFLAGVKMASKPMPSDT